MTTSAKKGPGAFHDLVDRKKLYKTLYCLKCRQERQHIWCMSLGHVRMCSSCLHCCSERDHVKPGKQG